MPGTGTHLRSKDLKVNTGHPALFKTVDVQLRGCMRAEVQL